MKRSVGAAIAGSLYRLLIAFRGPACWHWRHFGFDYSARPTASGWDVKVLGRHRLFGSLRDWGARSGETIHIVSSGPSIATLTEPERLNLASTITVNGSFRCLSKVGALADLYVVSDIGFVRRQWDALMEGIDAARAVAVDHRVALEIARRDMSVFDRRPFLLFDNVQRPFGRSSRWWSSAADAQVWRRDRDCAFSQSLDWGFFPSCTVAYVALQIAALSAPRRIVLFGLDLNAGPRFYDETQPEKSMIGKDLEGCILPHFAFASSVLREQGIEVLNASPQSAVPREVFQRVEPNAYLETLRHQTGGVA